jgi:hypothetical protein
VLRGTLNFNKMRYLLIISLLAFLSSCTKEVKIDIPGYEKQLVVDGQISTGTPPFVLLSTTKDIYSPTDLQSYLNGFVSGAKVTVNNGNKTVELIEVCSDNLPPGSEDAAAELFGIPAEDLGNVQICAYATFDTEMFGEIGKTYTLRIEYEGKVYTSQTTLKTPVGFVNTFWKTDGQLANHGFSSVTFSDPGNEYNAYFWEVKRINLDTAGNERDPLFLNTFNPVFNDEFFNGSTFEFAYENPMSFRDENLPDRFRGYYERGDSVVIKFSSLDSDVYEYFEKKYVQINNGGSPFSVPANIPTNIVGGALGVWAGFSTYYDTLYCQD